MKRIFYYIFFTLLFCSSLHGETTTVNSAPPKNIKGIEYPCLNKNMPTENVRFEIVSPEVGVKYYWTLPASWEADSLTTSLPYITVKK